MAAREITPSLRQLEGVGRGRVLPLALGEHVIGRDEAATIRVEGPDTSRQHARLVVGADGIEVEDLESKNGVFVDARRVRGRAKLGHGARLRVGDAVFEVQHPGAQVVQALARAGETTVTRAAVRREPEGAGGLAGPLAAAAIFAAAIGALLWWW